MLYGILGDIHGNLEALERALRVLEGEGVERILQVGDIVGYGADPVPCIQRLRDLGALVVAGNHDWAVIGNLDPGCFNPAARQAVEWTRQQLGEEERAWLESLPLLRVVDEIITLVHASPDQPELFDYILNFAEAEQALASFETAVCFVGHSHVPVSFLLKERVVPVTDESFSLNGARRVLINVGSVGQPRDEDARCACGVFDSSAGTYRLLRSAYDVDLTASKIVAAGLPRVLAERLYVGM